MQKRRDGFSVLIEKEMTMMECLTETEREFHIQIRCTEGICPAGSSCPSSEYGGSEQRREREGEYKAGRL